ncbi:MAG: APC family permease, partial [Vulcanimicrobiaceae bacterium]
IVAGLATLNIIGVRESTAFQGIVSGLDILSETSILFFGFLFAFRPELLVHSMQVGWPTSFQLMNGISLAIISFVGLESISHAAEETQRPASIIPRTSIALILTILIFALSYSNLALGMQPWHTPAGAEGQPFWHYLGTPENADKAVAIMSANIPLFGLLASVYVPLLGAILLLISSNSGVFGSSRIAYSMSQSRLLPTIFERVHPRYRTPVVSIIAFSAIAVVELIFATLQGSSGFEFLGDLYAFGAAASYTLVFVALMALRINDPLTPRAFKIPGNIRFPFKGETVDFPIIGVIGLAGIVSILVFVLITHHIGRIAGPAWIIIGVIFYLIYRKRKGLSLFGSRPKNWQAEQIGILRDAGELELMDEYLLKIKARDERRGATPTQ